MQDNEIEKIVAVAVQALEDIKAVDITVTDTSAKTPLFSRLIVASGESSRKVKALANNVEKEWKEAGYEILGSEGLDSGEWALIDEGDVVVHVMLPETRSFYDIETLWGGENLPRNH